MLFFCARGWNRGYGFEQAPKWWEMRVKLEAAKQALAAKDPKAQTPSPGKGLFGRVRDRVANATARRA